MREEFAETLPKHMDAVQFQRVVASVFKGKPELLECQPASIRSCLREIAALGLEPGPLGHSYLIPFRDFKHGGVKICTLILGYKGLIELAHRGSDITVVARTVYNNDEFDAEYGLNERLYHKPNWREDRGESYAYYGIAHYRGRATTMVMSKAEVNKFRERSRAKSDGPWVTDYDAMAMKTVLRRMATFWPLRTEYARVIARDELRELDQYHEDYIDSTAEEVSNAKSAPKATRRREPAPPPPPAPTTPSASQDGPTDGGSEPPPMTPDGLPSGATGHTSDASDGQVAPEPEAEQPGLGDQIRELLKKLDIDKGVIVKLVCNKKPADITREEAVKVLQTLTDIEDNKLILDKGGPAGGGAWRLRKPDQPLRSDPDEPGSTEEPPPAELPDGL
jgi:recombination protein RecT